MLKCCYGDKIESVGSIDSSYDVGINTKAMKLEAVKRNSSLVVYAINILQSTGIEVVVSTINQRVVTRYNSDLGVQDQVNEVGNDKIEDSTNNDGKEPGCW